jgi:thioredoxin reductase (NADPH)
MTDSPSVEEFEVVVIGGGPAGLTSALYTTRLGHDTALIDRGGGRAAMMLDTHNVIGVPESVSGNEFLQTAREQLEGYGTSLVRDFVTDVERTDDGRFLLAGNEGGYVAERVVFAMGFNDERPKPPLPRTGRGLHYCLHCDAYMFVDESVYVMGHSDSAAYVAMIMLNFTDDVDILLRGDEPTWSDETDRLVRAHPVDIVEEDVVSLTKDDEQLDVEMNDDGTVDVDDHGRTSVEGIYAVGDIVPGHNQIPVAMGMGAKAGIAIHMDLREFPKSLEEIEAEGPVDNEEVPAMSEELRETARAHGDD